MTRFSNFLWLDGSPGELFVEQGRVVSAGSASEEINLNGGFVMPAFMDAHCHILPAGLDLLKLNLMGCQTKEEMLDAVRDWNERSPEGWLHAVQYDQTRWPGAEHLTRHDLDNISTSRPILLRHSNGHASVANSAALAAAQVTKETPDPKGGEFVRDASGEPTGVLLEKAHEIVTGTAPEPELEEMIEAIIRASDVMRKMGITTASDMMTGRWNLDKELTAYRLASERGCAVRLRLCIQWATVIGPRPIDPDLLHDRINAMNPAICKVLGLKVFADGAIGSATAAIHGRFRTTGGQGQLIYSEENLRDIILRGDAEGWQMTTHTIGDRSTDLVMDALEQTQDPSRHRIEHAMILSDEQIARLNKLDCHVTMQPEFLMRFGHSYKAQLDPDVFPHLKRARSVLDAGIRLSFSSDRPIVPGHPADSIHTAVHRPEGFDQSENVTMREALDAWTICSADANGDLGELGTLKEGEWADFVVLNENPLETGRIEVSEAYLAGSN